MSPALVNEPSVISDDDVRSLILNGEKIRLELVNVIRTASVQRTIEGASTLTIVVRDRKGVLLNEEVVKSKTRVKIDTLSFVLVKVEKQGWDITLTFEDEEVNRLRLRTKFMKVYRDKLTRAEFILKMIREEYPLIRFFSPSLHVDQPIGKAKEKLTSEQRLTGKKPGISEKTVIFIKKRQNGKLSREQLRLAERMLDVAASVGADYTVMLSLMEAAINERTLSNGANVEDHTSVGALEILESTRRDIFHGSTSVNGGRRDIELITKVFLESGFTGGGGALQIRKAHPDWSSGRIATRVMMSSSSTGDGPYGRWVEPAKELVAAYGGPSGKSTSEQITVTERFEFTRGYNGKKESTWEAGQRLAQEVGWRLFASNGTVFFMSDTDLMRQKPRMVIDELSDGIDWINFDIDTGKKVDTLTIDCHAKRWFAPPGTVIEIKKTMGPAAGRWLVHQIDRPSLYKSDTTIECKRAQAPLPEPAPSTKTVTIPGTNSKTDLFDLKGKTPKQIIDEIVIPMARRHGINVTVESVTAANHRHGKTKGGGRSDHQGPPTFAWAADMSNGGRPTPQMDALAKELSETFGIKWDGSGIASHNAAGFRFQLIYRINTKQAGNHFNHVHFGVKIS